MHVVRAYCDFFGFWRGCGYRRCRRAGRCCGDYVVCMEIHRKGVADRFDAARAYVRARIPADSGAPERRAWNGDPCTANWVGGASREQERAKRLAARRAARSSSPA